MGQCRLRRRPNQRQPAEGLRSAAEYIRRAVEPARRRPIARARVVLSRVDEPSDTHVPHRLVGRGVRQLTEGDGRHRCVQTQCGLEWLRDRWLFGVDPELVVHALNQLPARSQAPRELAEDLVLLIGSRECRVGAGLTVVVAQVLVSPEEPQADREQQDRPGSSSCHGTWTAHTRSALSRVLATRAAPAGWSGWPSAQSTHASYRNRALPCLVTTLITAPWTLPYSADAPTDWTCTS